MQFGLDHVQLAIPENGEELARSFYSDVLCLHEIIKPEALRKRGGVWYELDDSRQLHLGVEQEFKPNRKAHPCFVASELDLLASLLSENGHSVKFDDLNPPIRRFYVEDVFGNRLEFANGHSVSQRVSHDEPK